jgi:hypothetical protein
MACRQRLHDVSFHPGRHVGCKVGRSAALLLHLLCGMWEVPVLDGRSRHQQFKPSLRCDSILVGFTPGSCPNSAGLLLMQVQVQGGAVQQANGA